MMTGLQGCTSKQYKPGGDEASGFIHCPDDLDGLGVRPARERCIWSRTSASLSSANDSSALKATQVRLEETLASFVAAMIRTPGSSSLSDCSSALNPASEFGSSPKTAAKCSAAALLFAAENNEFLRFDDLLPGQLCAGWQAINPAYPYTARRSIARLLLPFPFLHLGLLGRLLGRGRFLVEIDNQFRALSDFAHDG